MSYRYIGSKAKLLPYILEYIERLTDNNKTKIITDIMSGTGVVSNAIKLDGYRVVANDVMTYSYYHNYVSLLIDSIPEFRNVPIDIRHEDSSYEQVVSYLNQLPGEEGYFFREFSLGGQPLNGLHPRNYFTTDDAKKIDAIRNTLITWKNNQLIDEDEHTLLLNDLILATNDIANIAGTYGHYLSSRAASNRSGLELKPMQFNFYNSGKQHKVMRGYAEDIASQIHSDICYIDPPYIKRQYAANYHILETLAREDFPVANGVSGLRPWRDQYSNLCTKTKGLNSFEKIIDNLDAKDILISYSDEGLFPKDVLYSTFCKFGDVEINEIEYRRFKSHKGEEKPNVMEYLFHIHKR